MKTTLYMAMSLNGFIAKENDDTPWSKTVWNNYYKIAREFKAVVLGRRTYEIMKKVNEFEKIGNPFIVVVTRKNIANNSNFVFVSSPKEALKILKEKGFTNIMIGGGGRLNSSFIKENLIDEIILDIEPQIFGKGIKLFAKDDFYSKLKLIDLNRKQEIVQLHYRVLK